MTEPVYAFRRRGQDDFCTCTFKRYTELSDFPEKFEMRIFYTAPQPSPTAQAADAEARRVDELTELRKDDTELIRQLVEALKYHRAQTRPIHQTNEAIIRGRARLEGKP